MNKHKYINGPINAVRLESSKKVIYLFMDHHSPVDYQTQCPTYLSKDFKLFLSEELEKIGDTHLDFFMEIGKTFMSAPISSYKDRYIDEIGKFFKAVIKMDKEKNLGTLYGKNIRFHWIDIRDFFKSQINSHMNSIIDTTDEARCDNTFNLSKAMLVHSNLVHINQKISFIYSLFDKKIVAMVGGKAPIDDFNNYLDENIKKIMTKINEGYKHSDVYSKIQHIYRSVVSLFKQIIDMIDSMVKLINEFVKYLKTIKSDAEVYKLQLSKDGLFSYAMDIPYKIDTIDKLHLSAYKLDMMLIRAFALLVDLYFLRRFVDKDYISHAIVYTGIAHSIQYVYTLVKEFDMKITHASYIKTDIDSAMKIIKSSKECDVEINELFHPPYLMQCVDLTEFPEKFE